MSAQIIELLIFAGIAFFIINKLIATLGSTSEDDPAKGNNSFFGEAKIKDVTYSTKKPANSFFGNNLLNKVVKPSIDPKMLYGLIVEENSVAILSGLEAISKKLPSFEVKKYINSAKTAFELIIKYANDDNIDELVKLVDKKYLQEFPTLSQNYGEVIDNSHLDARISEAYSFANNIFIKILFTGEKITSKMDYMEEEWTFSRSLLSKSVNWFLINIDQERKRTENNS